ncbi:MAG TPA: PQQ-binding-like beta-propeller repeat protein [Rhizomicrobium sp.]|nr:PQQ-binding-like beta-propeller repeat protein [Rhizomicrobium sp.]
MINNKTIRTALCLTVMLSLSGCAAVDMFNSLTAGWFSSGKKSNIKGQRFDIMSLDDSLKPDPELANTPVTLPAPYANPEWPEPGGYASNAMYHLQADGALSVAWKQDAGKGSDADSRLTAEPIVAGGRIYVLDAEAHVYAFDARTGTPLWDEDLAPKDKEGSFFNTVTFGLVGKSNGIDPSKGFGGGVCFDDGKLFVTTGFGSIFALDPANGKQIWTANVDVPIINAPVANGGRVFVSSQDNHFYAYAELNGRRLWDHQGIVESASILESTSAAVAGEYVVAPYSSGELYALRVVNGRPAWNDLLTRSGNTTALSELDDIAGKPVIDRDMVFAISHSGTMVGININTGDRVWSRDIGGVQTPWVAGDFIYVITTDAQMLCLQRKDGRLKWIHQLPRWQDEEDKEDRIFWAGPVLVSNRLITVSSTGYAEAISPYTGQLMGRIEIPDGAYISPVVANQTLYILTNDAQLVALR